MKNINDHKRAICLMISIITAIIGRSIMANSAVVPGISTIGGVCLGIVAYLIARTIADGPLGVLVIRQNMERVGLVNKKGEAPYLLSNHRNPSTTNGMILTFCSPGIPRDIWAERQTDLEAALNVYITKIKYGKDRRTILIYAVPAGSGIVEKINWDEKYLETDDFVLALGAGLSGIIKVNLRVVSHMLIGGATGSGKTILLKNLIAQAIEKGASIYIADLKGGLDYPHVWRENCHLALDEESTLATLRELVGELQTRKGVFQEAECADIYTYNTTVRNIYKRIIFACDEVGELTDRTGRSREDGKRIDEIIGCLSTIARQGRAVGIHLILATQRPDANVLPGQIKNNMTCRICGRADNVLSQIILDNVNANDAIPKDAQGRFIMDDGTEFQGFWFSDKEWEFDGNTHEIP